METQTFLKYRRVNTCWVCCTCETENEGGKCRLCGAVRMPDSVMKPAWESVVDTQYVPTASYGGGEGSKAWIGLVIAGGILTFVLMCILLMQ